MLPAAGSRYLVPVLRGVQSFFRNLRLFFSFGIPIERRVANSALFEIPAVSFRGQSEPDRDALRPAVTAAAGGRRQGRAYMNYPVLLGKFFPPVATFF